MSEVNPQVTFVTMFCSGCGGVLDDSHKEQCFQPHGKFCSQCGQPSHIYVCYPDARKLEQLGFNTQQEPQEPKKLKPLW